MQDAYVIKLLPVNTQNKCAVIMLLQGNAIGHGLQLKLLIHNKVYLFYHTPVYSSLVISTLINRLYIWCLEKPIRKKVRELKKNICRPHPLPCLLAGMNAASAG